MSNNRIHPSALALLLGLMAPAACAEGPDEGPPLAAQRALNTEADRPAAIALRLEQAERNLDTARDVPATRKALAEVLQDPATTPEQRDQAKLAMSRVLEAEGDREAAISAVEALLAEHGTGPHWALRQAAEKRLRFLVTGSEETAEELAEEPEQASPFAHALARYYPVSEAGQAPIALDVLVFGGNPAVSERLRTFALEPAIRQQRRQACPRCDDKLSIGEWVARTDGWLGIPAARARLGSSLAVFYFDLGSQRIPARYDAELPLPTAEIAARLAKGDGLVAAREREGAPPVILIAAPRKAQLPAVEEALAAMTSLPTTPVAITLPSSLTKEEVQATVRSAFPAFRTCYEELLGRNPAAAGTIPLQLTILRDGTVSDAGIDTATATLRDATLDRCMTSAISSVRFPAAEGVTTVVYPVAFSPGE